MLTLPSSGLRLAIFVLLLSQLIVPSFGVRAALQSGNLRILGPNKQPNPVVNENNQIKLIVVDASGQPVTDVTFTSDSPDVATVDNQGNVVGKQFGFATITARRANGDSASVFVMVVRVSIGRGPRVAGAGDIKVDTGGRIYFSDTINNVILRADSFADAPNIFAGQKGIRGRSDGSRLQALFAGPTGLAIDNSTFGGLYVADTLNHSVRKIGFNDFVTTVLGTGAPGVNINDVIPFAQAAFNGLRSLTTDTGGNLFIADTENHAIFYADFSKQQVVLLAGQPGMSGKVDGRGRAARFTRPTGIALSPDGRTIALADMGNNLVRFITRDGDVGTLGNGANEILFDEPQSVSFDEVGNIYVLDNSGVEVVTRVVGQLQVVPLASLLAQPGTFVRVVFVLVRGTETIVFDAGATSDAEAVKVVTVGAPEITSLSQNSDRLEGGAEVIIAGKNFAPESFVVLGDRVVTDAVVESATRIRFRVPPQNAPGSKTLLVQTRGGMSQRAFSILSKPFLELADGEITTVAGGVPFVGDGGRATSASLRGPSGVALDGMGNLFIADSKDHRIRRIDIFGVITTVAGNGIRGSNGDGGPAISASLNVPQGIAVDGSGNLFITDSANDSIRRLDANTDIITKVAGNGTRGFRGDGGPALNASLNAPQGIAVDGSGNLFIADSGNNRIRRVDIRTGIITTVAGNGIESFSGDGGPATSAGLSAPQGIAVDEAGNLFIADFDNNRIRRVNANTAIITTVAGNGGSGFGGDGGPAIGASLKNPSGVAIDGAGNLFITDSGNNRVRRVDASTGIITTVAGNGATGFSGDGGPSTSASLNIPQAVAVDGAGDLFISDNQNNRIRRVGATTSIITTVAGTEISIGDGGPAVSASLDAPTSMAVDRAGNLFIADQLNYRVRRVDASTGIITTVAGNGIEGFSGDGGPATSAGLSAPQGIALDGADNLFIPDTGNNRIRRVDASTGIITTVAGNGTRDFSGDGGSAISAGLNRPTGITLDGAGNLFIADFFNSRVRRVDASTGIITTVAGNGSLNFGGDGGPATGAGLSPADVAVDGTGNLFIADFSNGRIRRVDGRTGIITTVAGSLVFPLGVAVDGAGNLFVADTFNSRVGRVDTGTGIVTTVAGNGSVGFSGDGGPATDASLAFPTDVAIDGAGNLFIADTTNNAIRAVKGVVKGGGLHEVVITGASFAKPNLLISGTGFGSSGAQVNVNGRDISSLITSQTDTAIILKGSKKKLNLKRGPNQITVTVGGVTSNTFVLEL